MPSRGNLLQETVGYFSDLPTPAARLRTHFRNTPVAATGQQWSVPMVNKTPAKGKELVLSVGARVAAFYRRHKPAHTAKELANEIGCSPETAKKYLAGNCPANKHLFAMWRKHGAQFAAFVFADIDEQTAAYAKLAAETERLHRAHKAQVDAYEKAFPQRD